MLLINLNIMRRKNRTLWASWYGVIGSAKHHLWKILAQCIKLRPESEQAFSYNQQYTGNIGTNEHFKQQHRDTLSQILQNKCPFHCKTKQKQNQKGWRRSDINYKRHTNQIPYRPYLTADSNKPSIKRCSWDKWGKFNDTGN